MSPSTMPECDLDALPGDWWAVNGQEAAELELELVREMPVGHVLHDASVQAVAVKRHLKDVVYWVPGAEQWALVHLTRNVETNPSWPATTLAADWNELVAELID
jgi:hypothetical protein